LDAAPSSPVGFMGRSPRTRLSARTVGADRVGRRLWSCFRIAAALAALSTSSTASLASQQREDLYTVPARARYQPGQLEGKRPLTRAERTAFAETSLHADVIQFIDSLVALGARIERGSIGKSAEGRDLPYVIASRPLITTPEEARRLGRPVAYVQANIHAGEVEGKEAMLAMLRDLLFDSRPNVLDSLVLIVQPIYNADGNERLAPDQRAAQNGPALAGTRRQAQEINLNRDYVGADAPETRASLAMLERWKPDLFMDLHTTDGSIHGYALTYAPTLTPTAIIVGPYLSERMMPEIRRRVRERQGFETNDYGDFARSAGRGTSLEEMIADSVPAAGWTFSTYSHIPRYGTNYYGLHGRLSILSEAFSHDPFPRRVASTYAFVGEILSYVAEHAREVVELGREADARIGAWAAAPGSSPPLALRSRMDTTRIEDVRVEVVEPYAENDRREAGMPNRRRTGIVRLVRMPVMASFTPTLTSTLPFAYAFAAPAADSLLPILARHGIEVEQLTTAATVTAQGFTVRTIMDRGRNETPRSSIDVDGAWAPARPRSLPAGSYVVRAGQPSGLLAFYLLEAESDDGLAPFLTSVLREGGEYPIVRITAPAALTTRPVR
jgi:hypothetical protein